MKIIKLDATDSTNSYLKRLQASNTLKDFTVVVTDSQIKGRGQRGAHWESEAGKNLTMSILKYYTKLQSCDHFMINTAVSLALIEALKALNIPQLRIKWPNDIMSGNSKICGILIENIIKGNYIKVVIVGIGLNVNQTKFKNLPKASSIRSVLRSKTDIELDALMYSILQILEDKLQLLDQNDHASLKMSYESNLFRKGVPSNFMTSDKRKFKGSIEGVSDEGKLKIKPTKGDIQLFDFKEITLLN